MKFPRGPRGFLLGSENSTIGSCGQNESKVTWMGQLVVCEGPGSDPQHCCKKLHTATCACNPGTEDRYRRIPVACWLASLTESVHSGFRERPCLKTQGGEQLKTTPSVDLWPPPASTLAHTSHMNMCTHAHVHVKKTLGLQTLHKQVGVQTDSQTPSWGILIAQHWAQEVAVEAGGLLVLGHPWVYNETLSQIKEGGGLER